MFSFRGLRLAALVCSMAGAAGCNAKDSAAAGDGEPEDSRRSKLFGRVGSLSGLVVDVKGNRIAGASVQAGALKIETDQHGAFDFDEVEASDGQVLIVTRRGYSTGRVPLTVLEASSNHARVTLQRADIARLADPSEGGDVRSESGVTFKLAPGQVVDEDGDTVTSPVEIMIALINDRDEMAASPGGMMTLDPNAGDMSAQVESFGMVEVSMSSGGDRVRLRDGSEVELEFPLARQNPFSQNDKVGLWHFDESDNLWGNEGEGRVSEQNRIKSLVGHFSWWSAGEIMTTTCLLGRVLDADGAPAGGANLSAVGRSYLGSSYATSNADGEFCIEARVSSVVRMSTLVRSGDETQALAVHVNTPSTPGSCGQPSTCYMLDDLAAVASE